MTTNNLTRPLAFFALLALPWCLSGQTVTQPTSVRLKPDASAPVLSVLPPGSPVPAAVGATAPSGWSAVQVPGPHEVYVDNKDITKALDVKPGASYRTDASSSAPVLATADATDEVEITGLRGRWTQLRLNKPVTGYIQTAGGASAAAGASAVRSTPASAPAAAPSAAPTPAPAASAPAAPVSGRAVPMVNHGDGGLAALPRLFEGRLVSTRHPLRPRRPYDFALEDETGTRIAYVDISRLLLTDQIENYVSRHVTAYGPARAVPETRDIVVVVESLQLR